MRICYIQHVPFEGPGLIENWAHERGHRCFGIHLYEPHAVPTPSLFDFLVVMGGPMSVHDEERYHWLLTEKTLVRQAVDAGKLVLGVCLGAQLIGEVLGADVHPAVEPEIGWFTVKRSAEAEPPGFEGVLPEEWPAFHWHGESVDLPPGAFLLGSTHGCRTQGFAFGTNVLALQFHLEADRNTVDGLLANCGDDLVPGVYVQSPEDIRRGYEQHAQTCASLLYSLLERLASLHGES
jgi:GMP synthase-like glutamine amidotransferase